MSESKIGTCKSGNTSFLSVIEPTDAIRKRCNLDNYEQLKEKTQAFTYDQETNQCKHKKERTIQVKRRAKGNEKPGE